ncbi:hypothetical protein [Pulveribacter suum]|uniref:Uncharacterized protein n=1 Tax=Pulveribacter suum TaxID=2116657 RepID=A0A2P1NPM6_9BURK|nr:hypothetical protein [Pulveribacter suum]AVP59009.1 hypothetical protein C7H73_06525 [Pulveribacter suum]
MVTTPPTYHAPVFEPTVDELEALKQLELQPSISVPQALHQHLSGRLLDWGYLEKTAAGGFAITDAGRKLVQRRED